MRRFWTALTLAALAALALSPTASAQFGFSDIDVTFTEENGDSAIQAGTHPFNFTSTLEVNTEPNPAIGYETPVGAIRDLTVTQIPGLAGKPTAVPRCSTADFLQRVEGAVQCSHTTVLGTAKSTIIEPGETSTDPVYNLEPPPGVAAKIGFWAVGQVPVTVEAGVNPNPPYNIVARLRNVSQAAIFYAAEVTIWGNPSDEAHDAQRGGPVSDGEPFITLPRACEGPLTTSFEALSWQGDFFAEGVETHNEVGAPQGFIDCDKLELALKELSAQPTTDHAESPSGLDVDLRIEDDGLTNPDGTAFSDIKKTVLTLPEGMTLNPSIAEGLVTCSPEGFEAESLATGPGEGCPEASKVGTVEVETPLLEDEILKGTLFVASQNDNPFNSLIALYMVIKHPELGILVKLAGRVEPDPVTGQIVTIFGETPYELPQFPLGAVRVHLREGGRSPLVSPPTCGTYETEMLLTPWANPDQPVSFTSEFEVTKGVGGGGCPSGGGQPFEPGFSAGTTSNAAGEHSPFHLRLTRRDGDQDLTRFDATLPPGVTAKLAGVSRCPQSAIEAAKARTGKEELADPSCPANSLIGTAQGGAGVGSQLTYVPGMIYMAGPFGGAPLSVVAIVPAVAGPFDVGTVVVQQALHVDPRTAKVRVDGAASDPIPHILAGIPLRVRDIRVDVDRPSFTLNPTSCEEMAIAADIWGGGLNPFSLLDDSPVARAARFQAADCAGLAFKPRLGLRLKGGMRRGGNPALRVVFRPRAGDANTSRVLVRFPRSAFVDQSHIRTVCTRVQFAADACPQGAIYGSVKAFTPLLDEPLQGPVYLRSSDNLLPDLVFDLHGLVDFEAVARIDSIRGGLRAIANGIPDAPVSRVVIDMQGGKRGLIINSRNLCTAKNRANVRMNGHNGRRHSIKPVVRAASCKGRKAKRSPHGRRR